MVIKKRVSIVAVIFVLGLVTFGGCDKDNALDNKELSNEVEIKQSHYKDIMKATQLYESSILEVLSKPNLKSSKETNSVNVEQIVDLFAHKMHEEFGASLKSSSFTVSNDKFINENLLQEYLDKLSNRLLSELDQNLSKEYILKNMEIARNAFLEDLGSDENIEDWEKVIIKENVLLSSEMIIITLRYGDKIDNNRLKGFWSWLKKHKKKIECSLKSAGATAVCASAVGGNWIAWLKCAAATSCAISCWRSL